MGRFLFSACLVFVLSACGAPAAISHEAAQSAFDTLTTPAAEKRLSDMYANAATAAGSAAAAAARDEALGPKTDVALQVLLANSGTQLHLQLDAALADLKAQIRAIVRAAVDEVLGPTTKAELGFLREELAGAPMRADVEAIVAEASASAARSLHGVVHEIVQTELVPLKTEADKEAAKWMPIAVGFGVGAGLLLIALVVLVHVLRAHKMLLERLMRGGPMGRP